MNIARIVSAPQEIGIPDAGIHAARLRALAQWPALDLEVADWMNRLADLIDGRAKHDHE